MAASKGERSKAASSKFAFLVCAYYLHRKSENDFRTFAKRYKRNDMPEYLWQTRRKEHYNCMRSRIYYKNSGKNGEHKQFSEHFHPDKFAKLSKFERKHHTLKDCVQCRHQDHKQFYLLHKQNKEIPDAKPVNSRQVVSSAPNTPKKGRVDDPVSRQFQDRFKQLLIHTPNLSCKTQCWAIASVMQKTFEKHVSSKHGHCVEFLRKIGQKRKLQSTDDVTIECKRAILKEAFTSVKDKTMENDFFSLYTSDQSQRGYEAARLLAQKDTTQRPSRIRNHRGNIKHYQYDKSKLMSILIDAEDDLTKLNWKITSQDVSLRNRSGIWPGNGGHV